MWALPPQRAGRATPLQRKEDGKKAARRRQEGGVKPPLQILSFLLWGKTFNGNSKATPFCKGRSVGSRALGENGVAGDHKSHRSAEEDVTGEVVAAGDAREGDCAGQAVSDERNPAVRAVPAGNYCRHRHCAHRMDRIKAAGVERIVGSVKKTVGIGAVAGVTDRFAASGDGFEGEIDEEAVGEGFTGKQRRFLGVGILANPADAIHRCGNGCDESAGVGAAQNTIETAEAGGVAKWGSGVGV